MISSRDDPSQVAVTTLAMNCAMLRLGRCGARGRLGAHRGRDVLALSSARRTMWFRWAHRLGRIAMQRETLACAQLPFGGDAPRDARQRRESRAAVARSAYVTIDAA